MEHSHRDSNQKNHSHTATNQGVHTAAGRDHRGDHHTHHAQMVADFHRRFWICLVLTLPVLALAPLIQQVLGVKEAWSFPGDRFVQFGLASVIFFYGGWPFLKGIYNELGRKQPGMMTLIALAISVAYGYSSPNR